jgi:hypothetical protein
MGRYMFGIMDLIDMVSMTLYVLDSHWHKSWRIGFKRKYPGMFVLFPLLSLYHPTSTIFNSEILLFFTDFTSNLTTDASIIVPRGCLL